MFELLSLYKWAFIGQFCVFLSIVSYIALIVNSHQKYQYLCLALSVCVLWISYGILTTAFVLDDFSLKVVVDHTSIDTPILYKVVGVWGASAGSFHLWICLLSSVGLFLKSAQAWKFFAFHMLGFLFFQAIVSPPFETVSGFVRGWDLNPLLQDKSMVLHPPILYVGYLIFSYIFFAVNDSILFLKRAYQVGFFILTLGIMLGSYWAYYELGWGGFWYWDPVEVISLIPWMFYLLGFHLLKRANYTNMLRYVSLAAWPVVLICFALVRSGVLSSVHSFAADPTFLMNFVIFFVCTVIPAFLFNFNKIQQKNIGFTGQNLYALKFIPVIIWFGIFFIFVLSVVIPIFMKDVYCGPEFFKATVWPLLLPILALMSIVPYRAYSFERLMPGFLGSGIVLLFLLGSDKFALLSISTFCLCGFGMSVSVYNFICDKRFNKKYITMLFGHVGWYALITSCILTTDLGFEEPFTLTEERRQVVLSTGVQLSLKNLQPQDGSNYKGHKATIDVTEKGGVIYKLYPEIHYFMTTHTAHSRMGIHTHMLSQSAIAIESMNVNTLKGVYYDRPYIQGVWLSVFIILLALILG